MTQSEMNFTRDRTRYDQMEEAAFKYHKEHPEIYELFCRFTFDIINRGFQNYGADAIFAQIRWHTDRPDVDGKTTFQVNNNHKTFYTQWFARDYPQYATFFRQRVKISMFKPASRFEELEPQDFE